MAKQVINNGESGLVTRTKLNDNFDELYLAAGITTFLALTDTPSSYNAGRILFESGAAITDDADLFWDNTNKRLGIGNTSPFAFGIDIKADMSNADETSKQTQFIIRGETNSNLTLLMGYNTENNYGYIAADEYGVGVKNIIMQRAGGYVGIGNLITPTSLLHINGDLQLQNGTNINEFSIDGTLIGDSDDVVPTEKAVKTYIDAHAGAASFLTLSDTISSYNIGRILFESATGVIDNNNLFWDNSNDRLGINNSSPTKTLHVQALDEATFYYDQADLTYLNISNVLDHASAGTMLRFFTQNQAGTGTTYAGIYKRKTGSFYVVNTETGNLGHIVFLTAGSEAGRFTYDGFFKLKTGTSINEISIDGTLLGNSNDVVPTEQAVKTYVDAHAGGLATSFLALSDTPSTFSVGRVLFESGVAVTDSANLFWDNANNRMGINTTSPSTSLHVNALDNVTFYKHHSGITYFDFRNDYNDNASSVIMRFITQNQAGTGTTLAGIHKLKTGSFNISNNETGTGGHIVISNAGSVTATFRYDTYLQLQSGTGINHFSIDGTLAANSDDKVPTEKAVKTYVDGLTGFMTFLSLTDTPSSYNIGRILFEGSNAVEDDTEITWDNINKRLLIGTGSTTGDYGLSVVEDINTDGAFRIGGVRVFIHNPGASNLLIGKYISIFISGIGNTCVGQDSAGNMTSGRRNTFLGGVSGNLTTTGENNSYIGNSAGKNNIIGDENVCLGSNSGFNSTGSNNVFLGYYAGGDELTSNKLYIESQYTYRTTPLIYGEFDNRLIHINGAFEVQNGTSINEFSIDGTLAGDSDDAVPTEKAVKTYVDAQVASKDTFLELTDTISSYTAGRILFESASALIDDSVFSWDNVNKRLNTTELTATGKIRTNTFSASSLPTYNTTNAIYYIRHNNVTDDFENQLKNSGSVKITSNVDSSEPTFNLVPGTPQQIIYSNPLLDTETYFPETAPAKNVTSVYADVTVGVLYTGIFLENPVLGQQQYWRISLSYSGKNNLTVEGVNIILKNPISGFERKLSIVLPEGITSDDFLTVDVCSYADTNSLQSPLGSGTGGYQLFVETTRQNITVVIKDVARFNSHY